MSYESASQKKSGQKPEDESVDLIGMLTRGVPRPLVIAIAVLPAAIALFVFMHIARYQLAHRESECPFVEVRRSAVAGSTAWVIEEKRRCLPDVEEHRWLLAPQSRSRYELGRYPLAQQHFARGYGWQTRLQSDRVEVVIENPERGEMILREPEPRR